MSAKTGGMRPLLFFLFPTLLSALALGCTNDCSDLREEAQELKDRVAACSAGDTCVIVFSASDHCTGELGCGFAVQASHVSEAQSEADRIGEESADCTTCAQAGCVDPSSLTATCDAASGRCVLATASP